MADNFFGAISRGDLEHVKVYIEEGTDVDIRNGGGTTALQVAIEQKVFEIASFLVKEGANISLKGVLRKNALHLLIKDYPNCFPMDLLEKLTSTETVNAKDLLGKTPLHYAAETGQTHVVKRLIRLGADVSIKDRSGDTAAHDAAMNGNVTTLDILSKNGADLSIQNLDGETPLHSASKTGCLDATRFLKIELRLQNCDPGVLNIKNKDGKTAFDVAGNSVVRYILNPSKVCKKKRKRDDCDEQSDTSSLNPANSWSDNSATFA